MVRLPHPQSGDSQGQEMSLAPSADKQTHNYDTECSNPHPSISTLRSKGLSHSRMIFFFLNFLSQSFTNHWTAGKEEGNSVTPHYHFHPLHRHLNISRTITAERSPLHIGSSWTQTRSLWSPSASQKWIYAEPYIQSYQ